MNRLPLELDRLYGLGSSAAASHDARPGRALVLELAASAGWERLAAVWKGVQVDLELPAPRARTTAAGRRPTPRDADPARFLAGVMNDAAAPLALRVEAAKALLAHGGRS